MPKSICHPEELEDGHQPHGRGGAVQLLYFHLSKQHGEIDKKLKTFEILVLFPLSNALRPIAF